MTSAAIKSKRPLTQLNFEIEQAEAEAARLQKERAAVVKDAARAARRERYLRLARATRRPVASFEFWPVALLIVGPVVTGAVLFVLTDLLIGSFALAVLNFLVGLVVGGLAFASLLYRPADAQLKSAIADAQARSRLEVARVAEKTERLTEVNQRLQRLIEERRDQIASGKLQRAALLQRNWKSMRGAEWEDFVVEVCRTHGARVDRTGRIGSEDANLVADFDGRRVALLTEGEGQPVDSATIRRAIAAKDRHGCQSCAVVINRRFTGAAQHFAKRNGCTAIGASEFPDFVMGKTAL